MLFSVCFQSFTETKLLKSVMLQYYYFGFFMGTIQCLTFYELLRNITHNAIK